MSTSFANRWFQACDENHHNPVHRLIVWIALPVLFFCVLGFAWSLPVPVAWENHYSWFKWSFIVIPALCLAYASLSLTLAVGMLAFMALCNEGLLYLELHAYRTVQEICVIPFVLACVALFIGHFLEKQRAPFVKSGLLLLIGPPWLLSVVLRKLGVKY